MSDQPTPAEMTVRPARSGVSWVWIAPILALAFSLFFAWQNYAQRGTLIDIIFQNAEGIKEGETALKFRDVEVGRVEKVSLTADFLDVVVSVRVENEFAPFLDEDASFWIVRPDVSLRGVTGLETVLSGVFIEGSWDGVSGEPAFEFYAEPSAPLSTLDDLGTTFTLLTRDGSSIAAGAPILHKGIEVGYLEEPQLSFAGPGVRVNGFIRFPHDRNLTTATRFWDTSGFSISLGTSGVELDVNSLASLIEGGVAFDTIISGGDPISNGHEFDLFPDEETARSSVFANPNTPIIEVGVLFDGSVSGLTKGSEVRFQGIRIGQVSDLNAIIDETSGVAEVQLRAVLQIETGRLGMNDETTEAEAFDLLSDFVARGLKARLSTANILSGALIVELVE
ncbi:MAG: MlaD family protein, partial [Pseudomonadota bacterium]